MSASVLVSVFALLQQAVLAAMWATLSATGVCPPASRALALGALTFGAAFALAAQRPDVPAWLGYGVANLLSIVAVLLLHAGLEHFAGRTPRARRHAAVLLVAAAVFAAALLARRPWLVVAFNCAVYAAVLVGCVRLVLGLPDTFGPPPLAAYAAPLAIVALAQALRAVRALVVGPAMPVIGHDDLDTALVVIVVSIVLVLVLNITVVALMLRRMVEQLRRRGDHDVLTGLVNRRVVEARLAEQAALLRRHGTPHALLSIDVDRFKSVNDRFGHPAGDAALRAIAQALRAQCRANDLPARCGGEEFWVLLPHTTLDGALPLAERVVEAVRRLDVPVVGPLTVSVGVAVAVDPDEPTERLMRRVDAALYRAKRDGRDRVAVDPGPPGPAAPAGAPP